MAEADHLFFHLPMKHLEEYNKIIEFRQQHPLSEELYGERILETRLGWASIIPKRRRRKYLKPEENVVQELETKTRLVERDIQG